MTKSQRERAFRKKVEQLIAQATKMENEAVKNSIRILEAARKEIAATVASTEWEMYRLPQLKSAVERAMQSYAQLYNMDLNDRQLDFWDQGILLVDEPVSAAVSANIAVAMPQIDTTMLGILQGYGTDLVTGLAADANKKITAELTRGLLGRKSPFEVMQAVGKNLKDKSIFKSIAARAETITRNECGRVLEAANQARREQAAKAVPGLKKQWVHSDFAKVPRMSHLAADGQIRDVDQPFDVGGEKLMYPRDPAGSAENTINCGCYSVPYHEHWERAAEDLAA